MVIYRCGYIVMYSTIIIGKFRYIIIIIYEVPTRATDANQKPQNPGSGLQRNSLYRDARIADFEGILGFSVPSIERVTAGLMQIAM